MKCEGLKGKLTESVFGRSVICLFSLTPSFNGSWIVFCCSWEEEMGDGFYRSRGWRKCYMYSFDRTSSKMTTKQVEESPEKTVNSTANPIIYKYLKTPSNSSSIPSSSNKNGKTTRRYLVSKTKWSVSPICLSSINSSNQTPYSHFFS